MANSIVKLFMKALSIIGTIIVTQISNYITSETFKAQVKGMLKYVVDRMVTLVMDEKKSVKKA